MSIAGPPVREPTKRGATRAAEPPPQVKIYGDPPPPVPNMLPEHHNCVTTYNPVMRSSYTSCT